MGKCCESMNLKIFCGFPFYNIFNKYFNSPPSPQFLFPFSSTRYAVDAPASNPAASRDACHRVYVAAASRDPLLLGCDTSWHSSRMPQSVSPAPGSVVFPILCAVCATPSSPDTSAHSAWDPVRVPGPSPA